MASLESIKKAHDLGDEFSMQVSGYIPLEVAVASMRINSYKILPRAKESDPFIICFYRKGRLVETRKANFVGNVLHVSREPRKSRSFLQLFVTFKIFG